MWLEEFHRRHSEAAKRYEERHLDLAEVEHKLQQARDESKIKKSTLELLEEETDYWTYGKWWQELSPCLDEDEHIQIRRRDVASQKARKDIVEELHNRFKSIEGVSLVLRFLYPEEFGILSLPVIHFISLAPSRKPVDYYIDYLDILRGFRDHYKSNKLQRIADIDMAFWSAAHFSQDPNLEPELVPYRKEMYQDVYFQEVRFRNLLKGLTRYGELAESQYLVFARVLLDHDYQIAAAVAAKPFDTFIHKLAKQWDVDQFDDQDEPRPTRSLIEDLREHEESIQVRCDRLHELWNWRIKAVHDVSSPLRKEEARQFVEGVEKLLRKSQRRIKASR